MLLAKSVAKSVCANVEGEEKLAASTALHRRLIGRPNLMNTGSGHVGVVH
jgi:hypothetical protein